MFTVGNIYTYFHLPVTDGPTPLSSPGQLPAVPPPGHPMLMAWIICLGMIALVFKRGLPDYRFWSFLQGAGSIHCPLAPPLVCGLSRIPPVAVFYEQPAVSQRFLAYRRQAIPPS